MATTYTKKSVASCHWNKVLIVKGLTQILSRREHAPDRRGVLNIKMCLITQFYGSVHMYMHVPI